MRSYSERSLANLVGVHEDLRRVIDRALQESPVDFTVIDGLRTREEQKALVARGASRTMNSRHLTGHAVDLMPIDPSTDRGTWSWDVYHQLGPAVRRAAEAENVPIVWGGDWSTFKDGPHFELERGAYPAGGDMPREDLKGSRTVKGGRVATAGAAATAAVPAILDQIEDAQGVLAPLAENSSIIGLALAGITIAGIAWMIWARMDDNQRGLR